MTRYFYRFGELDLRMFSRLIAPEGFKPLADGVSYHVVSNRFFEAQ